MMSTLSTKSSCVSHRNSAGQLLSEGNIDQQLLARDVDNIAERPLTLAREVERDAAIPNAQVAKVQKLKPVRQGWVHDVKFLASG